MRCWLSFCKCSCATCEFKPYLYFTHKFCVDLVHTLPSQSHTFKIKLFTLHNIFYSNPVFLYQCFHILTTLPYYWPIYFPLCQRCWVLVTVHYCLITLPVSFHSLASFPISDLLWSYPFPAQFPNSSVLQTTYQMWCPCNQWWKINRNWWTSLFIPFLISLSSLPTWP